jgi:hypothetical protein
MERRILLVRGQRATQDSDLARRYGVPTKRLNQQARWNLSRFPADFMFPLSPVRVNVEIMRAFVPLRELTATTRDRATARRAGEAVRRAVQDGL